ncbi:MAG: hypothetical protein M3317_12560 [Actinomycetota bacterium]|nr:hypothetical protein [Actinomycetota bacterium]
MRSTLIVEFRVLFLAILAVIVPFGLLLYVFPSATSIYWAWNIANPRSAILIGSAYAGATVYYVLLFRANDWMQVRYGLGGLIVFSLVLLAATALHWHLFKAYHPTTLVGLGFYYAGPLLVPIFARMQTERVPSVPETGRQIKAAWRRWLIARAIFYPLWALLVFVLAVRMGAWWPWRVEPLDLRVFSAQIAIVGWTGVVALRGGLLWRGHRLFLVLVGAIGLLQLLGLALGTTPYRWSSLIGVALPLVFLEWTLTPLLMFAAHGRR